MTALSEKGAAIFGVPVAQFENWRWQMSHQIDCATRATILGLNSQEQEGFAQADQAFRSGITPYYAMLMHDEKIRRQALPTAEEVSGNSIGVRDPLAESAHSPVPEVVQVYPDRVAFCVAQLCPVYCRYCFRKRRDEEVGLHFNRRVIRRGLDYITATPAIRDVLITGGDPFIAQDQALVYLLEQLTAIPHVEIVRFGTRTPVTLPYRITEDLCAKIARFHPIFVNTHFNCVEEITPEARQAVANLVDHGIPVGNQSVLLKGVNDTVDDMLALLRGLLKIRVRPYYLFHPHLVAGTDHLRTTIDDGLAIMRGLRGKITGLGIPQFVVDTPSGKIPLLPDHVLGRDHDALLVQDLRGEVWREEHAF